MTPEKSKELIAICPSLFEDKDGRIPINCFGFECDDGWFKVLKSLLQEIRDIIERDDLKDLRVFQIKEKFGTLRFYLNFHSSSIDECIKKAEERSETVCEECGSEEGALGKTRGWISVLCPTCREKWNATNPWANYPQAASFVS